jgi:hypothetical protein
MAFAGLLIAAGGYWLISKWSVDLLSQHHNIFGLLSLPALDTDLAIAGLGLGLVIGPLTSASLRVVPSAQHGIASAAVVVARMTGMLIGVAALSAWGFYRLPQLVSKLSSEVPANASLAERIGAQATLYRHAFAGMYGEIFEVTVVVCVVGALLGLLISSRRVHAEERAVLEEQAVGPRA